MPVSPETEIAAAYALGRTVVGTRGTNPYNPAGTSLEVAQFGAWARGYSDSRVDLVRPESSIDTFFPPVQKQLFVITEAQIRALFTSPVALLPAVAGVAHVPINAHVYREAGGAYTLPGDVGVQGGPAGAQPFFMALGTGCLGLAGPQAVVGFGVGNSASGAFTTLSNVSLINNGLVGNPIVLNALVGNPSSGAGRLFITLFWRDWTVAPL